MKHLKKFNESLDYESKIKELCENYLAYLLDDGFKVNIRNVFLNNFKIILSKPISPIDTMGGFTNYPLNFFTWDDIKDIFLPFLILLNEEYFINDFYFSGIGGYSILININDLLNVNYDFNTNIKDKLIDYRKKYSSNKNLKDNYLTDVIFTIKTK